MKRVSACMCIFRESCSVKLPVYSDLHKCNYIIATRVIGTFWTIREWRIAISSLYMCPLIKLMGFPTCMWCHCGHVDFIILIILPSKPLQILTWSRYSYSYHSWWGNNTNIMYKLFCICDLVFLKLAFYDKLIDREFVLLTPTFMCGKHCHSISVRSLIYACIMDGINRNIMIYIILYKVHNHTAWHIVICDGIF